MLVEMKMMWELGFMCGMIFYNVVSCYFFLNENFRGLLFI